MGSYLHRRNKKCRVESEEDTFPSDVDGGITSKSIERQYLGY